MASQPHPTDLFSFEDQARIGRKTTPEGMVELNNALSIVCSPTGSMSASEFQELKAAKSLVEDYEIRLACLALDATLELPLSRDLDLRDDMRWQVRPYVTRGLRFGHRVAQEVLIHG